MTDDNARTITCSVCGCEVRGVCTHLGLSELNDALADVARLTRELKEARAALLHIEWINPDGDLHSWCPWCVRLQPRGHAPDCAIARALGERKEGG